MKSFHEIPLRQFLTLIVVLFSVILVTVDTCPGQLFRRGERLRSLERKMKRETKKRESEVRHFRDKIRSELSGTSSKEELRSVFDTIKDVIQTPPPIAFGPPGRLTLAYMVSIENLEELDAVLGKVAKEVESEELYYDFRTSSHQWAGNFIDPTRTSGFALLTNGVTTYPMLFVPILSADAAAHDFLSTFGLADERGIVKHHEADGFRWTWLGDNPYVQFPEDTIVVQKDNWGYFVPKNLFPLLPSDPQTLFPRFDGKYLIYDFVSISGLPRRLGNGALTIGELILRFSDRRRVRIGDTKIKLDPEQKEMLLGMLKFSRVLVNEVDTVFRGLKRNDETGDIIVETTVQVVPGGELWRYIDSQRTRTTLAGFFYEPDDATGAILVCDELDKNIKRSAHALVRYGFKDIEDKILDRQHQRKLKNESQPESGEIVTETHEKKKPSKDLKKAEDFFEDTFAKLGGKSSKKKTFDNPILENDEKEEQTPEFPFDNPGDDASTEIAQKPTPGEMAGSMLGSVGEFVSSTWNKSVTTALQAGAEQVEIELVRKFENLFHENIDRGVVDFALTVRPDGATLGAVQMTGTDMISTLLSAAQIKVSTDSSLRPYIRFNAREHKGFKISTIEIPVNKIPKIEKILGAETLPDSLREMNVCIYFAIRDDFLCFTAGSTPELLDDLLRRIDRMHPNLPLPGTTLTFSPYLCGRLFEPFLDDITDESTQKILYDFLNSPPESRMWYQVAYGPGSYYSTLVLPSAVVKILGEFGKKQLPFLTGRMKKLM